MSLKTYCFTYQETLLNNSGSLAIIEFQRPVNVEMLLKRFSYSWYTVDVLGFHFPQTQNDVLVRPELRYSNGSLTDVIQPGLISGGGSLNAFCNFYEPREYNFNYIPIFNNLQLRLVLSNPTAHNTDFYTAFSIDFETNFKYQ